MKAFDLEAVQNAYKKIIGRALAGTVWFFPLYPGQFCKLFAGRQDQHITQLPSSFLILSDSCFITSVCSFLSHSFSDSLKYLVRTIYSLIFHNIQAALCLYSLISLEHHQDSCTYHTGCATAAIHIFLAASLLLHLLFICLLSDWRRAILSIFLSKNVSQVFTKELFFFTILHVSLLVFTATDPAFF